MIQKIKRRIAKYSLAHKINDPFATLKTKRFYNLKSNLGLTTKTSIPIDSILIGQQSGFPLDQWIENTKEYSRISIPIGESPYVKLLNLIDSNPELLNDQDALAGTSYYKMMAHCIKHTGHYMGIKQPQNLQKQIKYFYELYQNFEIGKEASENESTEGRSAQNERIKVKQVYYSDCYEVVDGHHRLSILFKKGVNQVPVELMGTTLTYLQKTILRSQQTFGIELYQPLDKLEVSKWGTIRQCKDRLGFMQNFLSDKFPNGGTYLDFPCSYGYFVKGMQESGWVAKGYDIDESSVFIANHINGLSSVAKNDIIKYLLETDEKFDVVSCLSLLHHFVMKRIDYPFPKILNGLDRITKQVLILDTGQSHELQYAGELDDWNDDYVKNILLEHTSFTQVLAIGKDVDDTGKNKGKNGRTLFACIRE